MFVSVAEVDVALEFVDALLVPSRDLVGVTRPKVPCNRVTLGEEDVGVDWGEEDGTVPFISAKHVAMSLTLLVAVCEIQETSDPLRRRSPPKLGIEKATVLKPERTLEEVISC